MHTTSLLACVLLLTSGCNTEAIRAEDDTDISMRMTASEALAAGLIKVRDNTVEEKLAPPSALVQTKRAEAKSPYCPPMEGENSICNPGDGCDVRNLVIITCKHAT